MVIVPVYLDDAVAEEIHGGVDLVRNRSCGLLECSEVKRYCREVFCNSKRHGAGDDAAKSKISVEHVPWHFELERGWQSSRRPAGGPQRSLVGLIP